MGLITALSADSTLVIPEGGDTWSFNLFANEPIPIVIRMAVIAVLTFTAVRLFRRLFKRAVKKEKIHHKFVNNIVTATIYLSGILLVLGQLPGFDGVLQTVLAGSGFVALVIGLAAQESLGNLFNGMFISLFKPFEVGDRVHLMSGNITGYIEDITLRHTVIRTFINSRIIIPNSVISKEMIENSNFTENKASAFIDATIIYEADMELAEAIMSRAVESHPLFVDTRGPDQMDQPKSKVFLRNLGLYGVELRISMWTKDINLNFEACSDVRKTIKADFDAAGIRFAQVSVADPRIEG